tara:strand:- start:889 stop:1320 length:432 start_codon:yes stop_codon:yes gene_type:complete
MENMKNILIFYTIIGFAFSQEFEVNGNLRVTGNIDANDQRVMNIGSPEDIRDAVNTEFLQESLREDPGPFEFKLIYFSTFTQSPNTNSQTTVAGYFVLDEMSGLTNSNLYGDATSYFNQLSSEGWMLVTVTGNLIMIWKRPIG